MYVVEGKNYPVLDLEYWISDYGHLVKKTDALHHVCSQFGNCNFHVGRIDFWISGYGHLLEKSKTVHSLHN